MGPDETSPQDEFLCKTVGQLYLSSKLHIERLTQQLAAKQRELEQAQRERDDALKLIGKGPVS